MDAVDVLNGIIAERDAEIAALRASALDEHDQVVYSEAFVQAEAVRRFLARISTQRVIDTGLLDADVVDDLVASADRMYLARTQRISAARAGSGCAGEPGDGP